MQTWLLVGGAVILSSCGTAIGAGEMQDSPDRFGTVLGLIGIVVVAVGTYMASQHLKVLHGVEEVTGDNEESVEHEEENKDTSVDENKISSVRICYGSTTGKARQCAEWFEQEIGKSIGDAKDRIDVENLTEYDQDNLEQEDVIVFVVSTWTEGKPPENCQVFFQWLEDTVLDFRVNRSFLEKIRYAVIGVGNSEYGSKHFCGAAKTLDKLLHKLGGRRIHAVMTVDETLSMKPQISAHVKSVQEKLELDAGVADDDTIEEDEEEEEEDVVEGEESEDDFEEEEEEKNKSTTLVDLEDIRGPETSHTKEMVTPNLRKALTKEGYKIIGSHSAVKLCRWTKNQLRGRGGCYKHTCFGITSYQCMETTPALACANRCTFCWRHSTNPVGKEWKWKQDDPNEIVEQAIELHRKMIKEMRGVAGVQMDRFEEAFTVRHCALSLVGEPIMYPRINELIADLHRRSISSFLVTNAQFPKAIHDLKPVTQLYVSIDAATKDSLKAIDRPLFKDFWERFIDSLKAVREKKQRTVFRLTLVKEYNMSDLDDYAKLVEIGEPDFIEIKGVTYCGKSDASNLSMGNVPWHAEVKAFAEALCERTNGKYGCACEHAHSCLTLLAKRGPFYVDGKWHTWIDFDKFHELNNEYLRTNGEFTFTSEDYMLETPAWALWDAPEAGFDPEETRFVRTRKHKPDTERPPAGKPKT